MIELNSKGQEGFKEIKFFKILFLFLYTIISTNLVEIWLWLVKIHNLKKGINIGCKGVKLKSKGGFHNNPIYWNSILQAVLVLRNQH